MSSFGVYFLVLVSLCVEGFSMPDGPCKRKLLSIQQNENYSPLVGAVIPQCDEQTGNYKVRQCSASVGSCWCVDKSTGENVGEPLTTDENNVPNCEPNCFEELRKTVKPAFLVRGEPKFLVPYPRCDEKTGYFLPKQCSMDEKECWCVSKLGKELEKTRTADVDTLECKT